MREGLIGAVTALFIVGAPLAHAQQATSSPVGTPDSGRLSQAEFKMLTDVRVGVIKAALQLTPEQQQYWPAVEEAIRARAETRYRRLEALGERMGQWREIDPVQLYRQRADVLADRAAGLKKLADAWQPLYQTLSPDQKMRLRLVTVHAIEGFRNAIENRRMEVDDEEGLDLWIFPNEARGAR
ncbi:Spy/CpxP family protein refolding chaperone [Microvirga sp. BT689]|uniref:Spy/CpxP family protein refolding chaperone n=1 Tax=Microvirga arvi TaxID=2778731 RepID=UPI001951C538|nr:Spy/CpxP family protein refolding chaperone [Microvirga arvi]MBM6582203.1 Spy/CpxP family protein refolding chaperone [Microvirga arvi]